MRRTTMEAIQIPITTNHLLHLDCDKPVSPRSLAEALLGLEGVVMESRPMMSCLLGGQFIKEIQIEIQQIEIGSYKEMFSVRFLFGRGRAMERKIDEIRKDLRLDKMNPKAVVGVAVAAAILFAAYEYAKEEPARIQIENSFNQIATGTNLTGEELRELVSALLSPTQQASIRKATSKMVHPGGTPSGGTLTIDENPKLQISAEVIQEIPATPPEMEQDEPIEDVTDVQMVVRAADLDNPEKGWWGIIPDKGDTRVRVHVMPGVGIDKIPFGKYFQADVTITYSVSRAGNRKPKQYFLTKVHDEK